MTPRSELAAANLYPPFAALLRQAAATLEPSIYICIIEGYRPPTEQNADYAKGRDSAGHVINQRAVITNARAWQSWHQYRIAADIVPYLVGDKGQLNWTVSSAQYLEMVAALKKVGLEWGGDWNGGLQDDDHFQMTGLPASPTAAVEAAAHGLVQKLPAGGNVDTISLTSIWTMLFPLPPVTS